MLCLRGVVLAGRVVMLRCGMMAVDVVVRWTVCEVYIKQSHTLYHHALLNFWRVVAYWFMLLIS